MSNIESIVKRVDVPVIIKEVGFGMSKETLQALYDIGVNYVDVSGRGELISLILKMKDVRIKI